jgi:hypothetical protein
MEKTVPKLVQTDRKLVQIDRKLVQTDQRTTTTMHELFQTVSLLKIFTNSISRPHGKSWLKREVRMTELQPNTNNE